jgi:DsbC/DsbD-like thiol-disulfide interchange protein
MPKRTLVALVVACLSFGYCAAFVRTAAASETASEWVDGHGSRARLIAGNGMAGVEIELAEGWKTYWRSPGDAGGVPPSFDFSKSDNLAAAKVLYPAPKRFTDKAGDTVGYKGTVIFPVEVTPKDAGKPVELRLNLDYGVCKEICVPASAALSLTLPPAGATEPSDVLKEALAAIPAPAAKRRAGDPSLKNVQVDLGAAKPHIILEGEFPGGSEHVDVFVEGPDGVFIPLPKRTSSGGGELATFEIDLSDGVDLKDIKGKTLTATLVSPSGQSEATFPVN